MSGALIVTIHQPDFLPWLGFFDRWLKSDLFIVLDDVQFLRRGWHHRDKIKTAKDVEWLTVPVKKKGRHNQIIREVEILPEVPWVRWHLSKLRTAYAHASHFKSIFPILSDIYQRGHERLLELNIDFLRAMADQFGITTRIVLASSFGITSTRTQRLVDLVKAVGGDVYLTGTGSRDYLEEPLFTREGIEVAWQDFHHPLYPQLHGDFVPGLSCIDFAMNCGGTLMEYLNPDASPSR